jgi:hypothetical protein
MVDARQQEEDYGSDWYLVSTMSLYIIYMYMSIVRQKTEFIQVIRHNQHY